MIKTRHIPHYIIKSRNLFNSKMTEKMSMEIVDVLSKYNTTLVFTLDAFECVFEEPHFNNALLKHEAFTSTIMACFNDYIYTFSPYVVRPSLLWDSFIPHNATKSLLHYMNILQNLKQLKGIGIHYVKDFFRSMMGFLYYVKYKESNKTDILLASKRLIHKSIDLDNSCVKLRAATLFLINEEYKHSITICDTFLTFSPRHTIDITDSFLEYVHVVELEVLKQRMKVKVKTITEFENIMKTILLMFYYSVKLKSFPGKYDITQHNTIWIFHNFTNIFFHGIYMDVTFMIAEKWMVPSPIQYELLPHNLEFPFSGINLDPMFVSLQAKLLCYHSMGNVNGMAEMITLMNNFIRENTFTTQSSCIYLNMFTYKAGYHRQSVKSILQYFRIFPSRYNTASGYLKIVLQILNYLFVRLLIISDDVLLLPNTDYLQQDFVTG